MTLPLLAVAEGLAAVLAGLMAARAREPARSYLRFAAALGTALALADLIAALSGGASAAAFAGAVRFLTAALAPAALGLAAAARFAGARAAPGSMPVLVAACMAGLGAALTGSAFLAFAPLVAASVALAVLAVRHRRRAPKPALLTGLSAAALPMAAAADMAGGNTPSAFGLFFAVALLGVTLAAARRSDVPVQNGARNVLRVPAFIRRRG